jgi:hypothetical protein
VKRLVALLVAGALVVGCSSEGDAGDGGALDDEAIAAGLCGVLVEWNRSVSDVSNEASRTVADLEEPDEARAVLLEAVDRLDQRSQSLVAEYEELGIPDEGEAGRMVAEVEAARDDIAVELADIREELDDGLDGASADEILRTYFSDMEKVLSVAQPEAPPEGDPLRTALDAEPSCDHTISR